MPVYLDPLIPVPGLLPLDVIVGLGGDDIEDVGDNRYPDRDVGGILPRAFLTPSGGGAAVVDGLEPGGLSETLQRELRGSPSNC
jgi:hypothetical protein